MKEYTTNDPLRPTIVDEFIYEWLSLYNVSVEVHYKNGYAITRGHEFGKSRQIQLHRIIMKKYGLLEENVQDGKLDTPWKVVDHINGNRLDNRKENLRLVTREENMRNTRMKREKERLISLGEITDKYQWCCRCRKYLNPNEFYPTQKHYCRPCLLIKQKMYREEKRKRNCFSSKTL